MIKKVVASIEARMTSTRLPGKVLLPCVGKPILELLVERVKRSKVIHKIVVATTENRTDDVIVECAKKLGIGYFRGSEEDVVSRVTKAMTAENADIVVQLTGDNPLLDPQIIDRMVKIYLANDIDYISNKLVRSYPIGLDVQVASLDVLRESLMIAKDKPQHEHLFLSVYENPKKFKLFNLLSEPELCRPDLRWTMDTEQDYEFICAIYKHFYMKNKNFTSLDVIKYLDTHPEIAAINKNVVQRSAR
ncbi:MAG: glycosyltransferase family protein [Candidatus Curtissbacteria bacterium]|nr:glycosyltransferase family protein [Candidatus Curtissbacteria bacterium]